MNEFTKNGRIFVDMDGVLAEFRKGVPEEMLYRKGYFATLQPISSACQMLNVLIRSMPENVYILTSYLEDSPYAKREKLMWAMKYTDIDPEHIIFVPSSMSKSDYVMAKEVDLLIDDYGLNLACWQGTPVKFVNPVNNTKRKKYNHTLDYRDNPIMNAFRIQMLLSR